MVRLGLRAAARQPLPDQLEKFVKGAPMLQINSIKTCFLLSLLSSVSLSPLVHAADFTVETKTIGFFNFRGLADVPNAYALDYFLLGVSDLDGDGNDDLVFSVPVRDPKGRHVPDQFSKPVVLFWNPESGTYEASKKVQDALPLVHYARRMVAMPGSNGGTLLFIADTGLDGTHAPNCGGVNKLLHFSGKNVTDLSSTLPQIFDYTHGVASADVNNDGWEDIAVLNSPYLRQSNCSSREFTNESYLLLRKPNSNEFERAPLELQGNKDFYTAGVFVEQLDSDGSRASLHFLGGKGDGAKGVDVFVQGKDDAFELVTKIPAPKMQGVSAADLAVFPDAAESGVSVLVSYAAVSSNNGWYNRAVRRIGISGNEVVELPNIFEKVSNNVKENVWCTHLQFGDIIGDAEIEVVCTNNWGMDVEGVGSVYYKLEDQWKMLKIDDLKNVCGSIPKWFQYLNSSVVRLEGEDHLVGFWLVDPYRNWENGYQSWDTIEFQSMRKVPSC